MPDKTPQKDPGVEASRVEREVAAENRAETSGTGRRLGYNSNGQPELYPSDLEMLQNKYNLTAPEAEDLWRRAVVGNENIDNAAAAIAGARVVYRVRYEQVANPADHALNAVQIAAAKQEREGREAEARAKESAVNLTTPTSDRTQPEAGPYGPHAEYVQTTLPVEEVAHATGLTVKEVKNAGVSK